MVSSDLGSPCLPVPGLIDCVGFSGPKIAQLVLQRAGYPTAVAAVFAHALQHCAASGDRPAQLLHHLSPATQLGPDDPLRFAEPLRSIDRLVSDAPAINFDYRYLLRLVSPQSQRLSVACWRRYSGGLGWQRRCGPMPLERFLARFLEVPARKVAAAAAGSRPDQGPPIGVSPKGMNALAKEDPA